MYRIKDGNTLVNVSSSLLKHFGVSPYHSTYRPLDDALGVNRSKSVAVFLFDALGKDILKKHRKDAPFIYRNRFKSVTAVFPPTTVASTTSLLSGLYPAETGRLGWWSCLGGRLATTFASEEFRTGLTLDPNFDQLLPFNDIASLMNRANGTEVAELIYGFKLGGDDPRILTAAVQSSLETHHFVYGYWPYPDHAMHEFGTSGPEVSKSIQAIDRALHDFVLNNKDVLVISLADHGMVDVQAAEVHQDFLALTSGIFTIEPRAASFFVEEPQKAEFVRLFNRYYGRDFQLFTKSQVIKEELFGPLDYESVKFRQLLGDFLAVAIKDRYFDLLDDGHLLKGQHAGGTRTEALISLGLYNDD